MITIYGGHRLSYEEIGAMELLRSYGQKVTLLVPERPEAPGDFYATRSLISRIGVDVERLTPEAFVKAPVIACFGRTAMFDFIESVGQKPDKVLYGPDFTRPLAEETTALSKGMFDELFLKSAKYEVPFLRELVSGSNTGVEHRAGYVPYCSGRSSITNIQFSKQEAAAEFQILVDCSESESAAFPTFWKTLCGISCPPSRKKQVNVLAWSEQLTEQHGDPTIDSDKWHGELNAAVFYGAFPAEELGAAYNGASVLLDYSAEEAFPFAAARACLAGAVVVAGPNDACVDLVEHGRTGLFSTSVEESAYQISRVAWEPYLRRKLASAAYEQIMNRGAANLDVCVPWWKGVLPWG